MRRAIAVHTRGHWPDEAAVDTVTLAFLDQHRRRIRLVADFGAPFLLDLARAQHLVDGDGGLGGHVEWHQPPFDPEEDGAYAGTAHDHDHDR